MQSETSPEGDFARLREIKFQPFVRVTETNHKTFVTLGSTPSLVLGFCLTILFELPRKSENNCAILLSNSIVLSTQKFHLFLSKAIFRDHQATTKGPLCSCSIIRVNHCTAEAFLSIFRFIGDFKLECSKLKHRSVSFCP